MAVAGAGLHAEQRAQGVAECCPVGADLGELGDGFVVVFALDVPAECDAADDVRGCHAAVHAQRHVCVGDVLLVGGELADDLGAFEELLGLGEPARDRVLVAFAQARRHRRAVWAMERRSRRSVP